MLRHLYPLTQVRDCHKARPAGLDLRLSQHRSLRTVAERRPRRLRDHECLLGAIEFRAASTQRRTAMAPMGRYLARYSRDIVPWHTAPSLSHKEYRAQSRSVVVLFAETEPDKRSC